MNQIRFRPGTIDDGPNILALWEQRSASQWSLGEFEWAYVQAPGGLAKTWVIEAKLPSGEWGIVGHHGLLPIRACMAGINMIFAKTFKTMVLPEFRDKFLYLRFERDCIREIDNFFHATYSSAMQSERLRKPLGYIGGVEWIFFERGLLPPEWMFRNLAKLPPRAPFYPIHKGMKWIRNASQSFERNKVIEFNEIKDIVGAERSFFEELSEALSVNERPIPRRDPEDLAWRFWNHPMQTYTTLTHSWIGGAKACCTINSTQPNCFRIDDLVITEPRVDLLEFLLDAIFAWCANRGALAVAFATTTDGFPEHLLEVFHRKMGKNTMQRFRRAMEMPRRVTELGKQANLMTTNWNVTSLFSPL